MHRQTPPSGVDETLHAFEDPKERTHMPSSVVAVTVQPSGRSPECRRNLHRDLRVIGTYILVVRRFRRTAS
jgi:hypothetical protein